MRGPFRIDYYRHGRTICGAQSGKTRLMVSHVVYIACNGFCWGKNESILNPSEMV